MDEQARRFGEWAERLLRSSLVRIRRFYSPGDYERALQAEQQVEACRKRVDTQHQEIERLRELLNRQALGVVVTSSDGTSHAFDQATGWVPKDGFLHVVRDPGDPKADLVEVGIFAPGAWANVRFGE